MAPYNVKVVQIISAISKLRASVGGGKDQGIVTSFTSSNIVPTDSEWHFPQILATLPTGSKRHGS